MTWTKLGRVFVPNGLLSWARTHAYLPTAWLHNDRIRVFFAARDAQQFGRIGYVDLDPENPRRIIDIHPAPVLDLGRPGSFDEHGVSPLSVVREGRELWLYYIGWQRAVGVRYFMFTGLAQSSDGGEYFERVREVPVLDRCHGERLLRSGGRVLRTEHGFEMFYMAGNNLDPDLDTPTYELRRSDSDDGLHWSSPGRTILQPEQPDEFGFGRPAIVRDDQGRRHMWLSVRSRSRGYRIGYAFESPDGKWRRDDTVAGIAPSDDGWDSHAQFAADIIQVQDRWLMFYNGNDLGASGFGVAQRPVGGVGR